MKRVLAIAACSLPLVLASTAYSQGPSGRSGSDSKGVEAQAESTSPSGLAGSTGIKPDKAPDTGTATPAAEGTTPRSSSSTNEGSRDANAANRSASGDSTRHSSGTPPTASGDAAKPSKQQSPQTQDTPSGSNQPVR